MAGPTLTILTREPITHQRREAILAQVRAFGGEVEVADTGIYVGWEDFSGMLHFGAETGDALDPDRPSGPPIGFEPKGEFMLIGMTSNIEAHRAMAALAVELASHVAGVIELDGGWRPEFDPHLVYPDLTQSEDWTESDPSWQYLTPNLLRAWSVKTKFRLPK